MVTLELDDIQGIIPRGYGDMLVCHPRLVQTGLDLVDFPTSSLIHQRWEVRSFRSSLQPTQPQMHPNRLPMRTVLFCVDWKTENSVGPPTVLRVQALSGGPILTVGRTVFEMWLGRL